MKANQIDWLTKLRETLVVGNYGKGTIRNYCMEMRLLFQYYRDKEVEEITGTDIRKYILFIKKFILRFEQHILPKGFVKIRHYGYLRPQGRSKRIRESFGIDIFQCPKCKHGRMEMVATYRRGFLVKTYEDENTNIRNKDPAA